MLKYKKSLIFKLMCSSQKSNRKLKITKVSKTFVPFVVK